LRGIATDKIRNESPLTIHHRKLLVANVSEHVAEVVGELSQFKILLSKIGKKEQGTRGFWEQWKATERLETKLESIGLNVLLFQ
jgi:hypothetical protein